MKRNMREEIIKGMNGFSRTQKRLANYLVDNWAEIPLMSIEDIAAKSGVSMASITRLTRKMSCQGFHDFKNQIKGEHMRRMVNPMERFFALQTDLSGKQPLIQAARQDVKNINRLLAAISTETFQQMVEWIDRAKRVYTFGVGISAVFADLIAYTFTQIQKEAHNLDEGRTPIEEKILMIGRGDVVIFSSFFPYSKSTIEFARLAGQRGLKIVVFTDNEYGPLAPFASLILKIPRENILFTTSISALSVLLNAIATEIALKKKEALVRELKEQDRQLRVFYS